MTPFVTSRVLQVKIIDPQKEKVEIHSKASCTEFRIPAVQIGLISNEIPRMSAILAIFDPMILPSTKPDAPEDMAAIEVKSSGAEVAIETTVRPTTTEGIPNSSANEEQ